MIVSAACKISIDGIEGVKTIPLHRHGDIGKILAAFGFRPGKGYRILEQGFLDEHGSFLNRTDAWTVAVFSGQISATTETRIRPELYSEELY